MRCIIVALLCGSVAHAASLDDLRAAPDTLTANERIIYIAAKEFLERDTVRAKEWLPDWSAKLEQKIKDDESYTAERFVCDRARENLMTAVAEVDKRGADAKVSFDDRREFSRLVIFAVLRGIGLPEKLRTYLSTEYRARMIAALLNPEKELAKK